MSFFSDFFGGGEKLKQPYQPPLNIQNFMQPVPASEMQKVGDAVKSIDGEHSTDGGSTRHRRIGLR